MAPPDKKELAARAERQKTLEKIVQKAIDLVGLDTRPPVFNKFSYGAVGIDPKHLAVWFVFKTDAELAEATGNGLDADLESRTRKELRAAGYPEIAIDQISVSLASDEDIRRKTGGDYWQYFR